MIYLAIMNMLFGTQIHVCNTNRIMHFLSEKKEIAQCPLSVTLLFST